MDEQITQEPQTIEQPSDGGKGEKLYNNLISSGFTNKNLGSKDEFVNALQDPNKATKIYSGLRSAGFTEKNLGTIDEFQSSFSPPVKLSSIPTASDLTQQSNVPYTPQYADAHQQAISVAKQQQQLPPQAPKPQKEDGGILDKVSQAAYLPALNQGFNELVTKPLAGANDFIDRTIDKVYTGITGEQTPDWLRKGSGLDNIVKYYDDAYQSRDKPKNLASNIVEGAVGTVPLVASLFTGEGEVSLAAKAPEFISKATKVLGVTGAANAYKDATDNGKDYGTSALEAAKGELKGNVQGLTLDAQMLVGNAFGKNVANMLAEKGIKYGGKTGDAILHAIATGTVFGGTSAGNDLLQGKDVDIPEAMKQFGMGLLFEVPMAAKAVNEHLQGKSINENAAKLATASTAVSNMNAESTLRTLINTPSDQLEQINSLPGTHDELYANSIEQGAKAYEAEDLGTKNNHYANQMLLKTQADVKLIADKVADPESRDAFVQSITDSNELPPETKQDLLDKIAVLTPKIENDEKINQQNANAQESISSQAPNESGQEVVPNEEGQVLKNEGGGEPPLNQIDIHKNSEIPNETQPSKVEEKIVQDIHKNSPELSKIGDQKEYESHIENIFPKSAVSRILYHGSDEPIENFKPSEKGIYFSEDPDYWPNKKHIYAAKVNIENPEYENTSFIEKKPEGKDGIVWTKKDALEFFKDDEATATPEGKEKLDRLKNIKDTYEAVVFDPKQIHVLGSEKDINEFKKYKDESIQGPDKKYREIIESSDSGDVERLKNNLSQSSIDTYLRNLEKNGILKIKCP